MKKLYILLLLPFLALGQSQNQNYIKTTTYKVETASSISNPQPNQATVQVDYFDGTGRLIQQRAIKQAHGDGDIVTHVGYDNVGRPTKSYMPYVETSSSLLYNPNALQETLSFYNTPTYENTTNPYSEQQMEASPLGRVLKQGSPGEHWMVDFPSSTTDHTVKFEYQSNAASEVRLFRVTNTKNSTTKVYDIALVNSGFYGAGQLTKTIVKDENWIATSGNNHTTQEFRNKQGLVLLKRTFENSLARDTYYVYDDFGNLTYVIPPGVNTASSITTTILNDMCYQYKYDFKNRLVEKKLPGKDWEFIVYDKLDRPVLSGPVLTPFGGTQRGWMVSKFDAFGRVAYTAWVSESTFTSARRNTLQNTKDLAAEPIFETKLTSATTNNGVSIQYSNTVFPKTTYTILSINYYDNYTYPGAPAIPPTVEGQPVLTNAKGLSTGTWTRVLNASSVVGELSYVIYDYKARPVRTYQSNYLGGFSQTDSYMEDGLLLYTITSHKRTSQDNVIAVQENFEYTAQGRLVKHLHKLPNKVQERLSNNHYNPMGQLIAKNVGGTNIIESSGLQKVDYRYNIRGWLLEINDTQDLSSGGGLFNDLFSFKINYNTVDNSLNNTVKALYNGNIAEIYWRTASDNVLRKYGYSYDQMNRLLSAVYQKPGATFEVTNSYNETLSYDANGNISTLTRTGEFDDQLHNLQIDNLAYFYHPTRKNQLMKVTDYQNNPNGFKDDSDGTNDTVDDYSYDGFGNMISDQNKNISIIRYNHLNLPTLVDFGVAGKIEYLYNAAGVKLQKKVTAGTLITITDYLNGFQYLKTGSNPVELEFFPHAEGYVKVTDGNVYNYVYNYTDHLGNVRLSYTKDPASNVLTILEENNYYPFGLKHRNYNMSQKQYSKLMNDGGIIITPTNQTVYDYKLNGKEYQDELGLNMYAMDMRQYDPAIARWVVQDPVTHFDFSPYNAFDNNPVFWADPSGADSSVAELYDGLGRQKYDSRGQYITPLDRGDISHDVMTQLFEMRRKSERMGGVKEFVLPPGVVDFFAEGKAENELFRIYDADGRTAHVFYASFFGDEASFGNDFINWSTIGNAMTFGGIAYYTLEKSIHNGKYWVDAKGAIRSNDLLKKGPNGKYVRGVQGLRNSQASTARTASSYSVAGRVVGGIGMGITAIQYFDGKISGIEASVDLVMGLIGFTPWGAPISLLYFGGKFIYESWTGNTLFEKPTGN